MVGPIVGGDGVLDNDHAVTTIECTYGCQQNANMGVDTAENGCRNIMLLENAIEIGLKEAVVIFLGNDQVA